jgi:large subunit ribosomal protein L17
MRHRKFGRHLGRTSAHRKAMFRNMVTSLIEHGRITTTEAKAKELRRYADRTITRGLSVLDLVGKDEDKRTPAETAKIVHAMREAGRMIRTREVITKLFVEVAPKYKERPGGYTRIIKTAPRVGDNAPMAILELV